MKKERSNFIMENFWRYLANAWTIGFIALAIADFATAGSFDYLLTPFSVTYGAVLSLFVGTKEFNRWYALHRKSRHPGEVFVIIWSAAMFAIFAGSWAMGSSYRIPPDLISAYVMVLTVFAITQSSKRMHGSRSRAPRADASVPPPASRG